MENNPITVMYQEHEIIQKAKVTIEKINRLWEKDSESYHEIVSNLVVFFKVYADEYHHRKEEEVLFPAIKNHPNFVLDEIIEELESHHVDFRNYIIDLNKALNAKDYLWSYKLLTHYMNDLLDHIAVENDELFVLAENLFDEQQLETIYFNFKDIDIDLGETRKEEMEQSIDNLLVSKQK